MKCNAEFAVQQVLTLVRIPSPTGFTRQAEKYLVDTLTDLGFSPLHTPKGTVQCCLGGEGRPLALSAHVDTLGAMVRSIKATGRLRYTQIGGYTDNSVENENCLIHTRGGKVYSGTVQPVHASRHVWGDTSAEKRGDDTLEIVVDAACDSLADAQALGIAPGDYITWDPRAVLTDTGYLKSRHLDDKASSGVLLALAQGVSQGKIKLGRKVYLMFTVFEEVGHGASASVPEDVEDFLAVDMGCVGDDLACRETQVSICCKDSAGPFHYDFTNELIALAREIGADYAADIYPHYSSDTATALRAGLEARHALIGPGVFASHGYERTHVKGIENTLRLVEALVTRD